MVEAKDIATYIVEPTNANIDASSGFTVRKRFKDTDTTTTYTTDVSTMFDDITDQMTRPTGSGSTMKGGLLFLKNGTYTCDTAGIVASDSTDGANVHLRIVGETRERTILKSGFTGSSQLLLAHCSLDVENMTFDGNSNATINGINTSSTTATKTLRVKNCRFTNIDGFDIFNTDNLYGLEVSECRFDNQQATFDQFAFECTGYANIHDNLFDRTVGETTGESLTSGSAFNVNIHDNIFLRSSGGNAISLEGFTGNPNYNNVTIDGNTVNNGKILIGSSGTWDNTFRNVRISNNNVYQGAIVVKGPSSGSYSTQVKDVTVENNTLIDSWTAGVYVVHCMGYVTVRNNIIKNSNKSLDATTFDKGAIYMELSTDTICEDNSIFMETSTSNQCPFGIKYVDLINPTIRNNRILNRTANSSYITSGTHTGNKLISRNL